eukprot:2759085-Pyramimonas_sp.AAC.1
MITQNLAHAEQARVVQVLASDALTDPQEVLVKRRWVLACDHRLQVAAHLHLHGWAKVGGVHGARVLGRGGGPEGDGDGKVGDVAEPVPPPIGDVEQVASLERGDVALGGGKLGECGEIGRAG